jgi:hypothetical protein
MSKGQGCTKGRNYKEDTVYHLTDLIYPLTYIDNDRADMCRHSVYMAVQDRATLVSPYSIDMCTLGYRLNDNLKEIQILTSSLIPAHSSPSGCKAWKISTIWDMSLSFKCIM